MPLDDRTVIFSAGSEALPDREAGLCGHLVSMAIRSQGCVALFIGRKVRGPSLLSSAGKLCIIALVKRRRGDIVMTEQ